MAFVFFFFILNYNYINLNNLIRQIEREPPGTPEKQKLARLQGNIDENNPKTTDLQLRERKAGLSGASRWWGVQADHSIRHSVPSMRCHLRGVPAAYKSLKSQGVNS